MRRRSSTSGADDGEDPAQRSQRISGEIDAACYRWLGESSLALALGQGVRIAQLRLLLDSAMVGEDDPLVTEGLDSFQRRCPGKLSKVDT